MKQPSRIPRLFLDASCDREEIALSASQAHYLKNVLRAKIGHAVIVFNGGGAECVTEIEQLTKAGGRLRVTSAADVIPEPRLKLRLLQAVAKSEAMDLIVQKATELGVAAIEPVITEFCVVKLDAPRAARRLEHWQRIARSACEQSGRHTPPIIERPRRLEAVLASLPPSALRLVLDPYAVSAYARHDRANHDSPTCYILIGPEGGLSERDLLFAERAGFARVKLGPRILRTETAALVACSLAQARWGDLGCA